MRRIALVLLPLCLLAGCADDDDDGVVDVSPGDVTTDAADAATDAADAAGDVTEDVADTGDAADASMDAIDAVDAADAIDVVDTADAADTGADTIDAGMDVLDTADSGDAVEEPSLACLDEPIVWPVPPAATAEMTVKLIDFTGLTPLDAANVVACARYDFDCSDPIDTATTDAEGEATLTVPTTGVGFDGRIEATKEGWIPLVRMVWPPLAESTTEPLALRVVSTGAATALSGLLGATLDPERGHAFGVAIDCDLEPSAGLGIALGNVDEASTTAYFVGGLPDADAEATDASGAGVALNVVPGWVPATAFADPAGPFLGPAMTLVKPGALTSVVIGPQPPPIVRLECIGEVVAPTPTVAEATISGKLTEFLSGAAVAGATVNACDTDPCTAPIDTATTDAEGAFDVTVPLGATGFDGWLEITSDTTVSTIQYVGPGVTGDVAFSFLAVANTTFAALTQAAAITPDPLRGHMGLGVNDCDRHDVPGATFTVASADASTKIVYLNNGLPDPTATETDASGFVAVGNVPPGTTTVTATVDGTTVGTIEVLVREGWLTQANVTALPMP